MDGAVHLILFLAFWVAVITAAHHQPWWLPIPVGGGAALFGGVAMTAVQGGGNLAPIGMAGLSGCLSGLLVIGIRALMRKFRRDPFEARPETPTEDPKDERP